MFSKIILVCFFAALVLAEQDQQQGEKQQQQDTVVRRTVNKNIVDYTEKVQQQQQGQQPFWQQYKPQVAFTRDSEGIQKVVRVPGNPFFQGIRVNVKPYPGGYVAIRANGAEIVKPFTATPDTEQDQEIIIETQTPDNQQQQQILQQQEFKRNTPYYNPQQQYNNYLVRYPIWSRFLQPQQQQQLYYGQEYPYGDYYRRYGQYEDIYNQEQQGEYDRAVRDTGSKKDKKNKGGDKQEQQQEKFEQEGYNPYNRVPLYYQQYQRVPYQIYGRDYEQQQQQWPIYQQQVYGNPLLNRWLGYQQYQQYPFYQQQYDLPVYAY